MRGSKETERVKKNGREKRRRQWLGRRDIVMITGKTWEQETKPLLLHLIHKHCF